MEFLLPHLLINSAERNPGQEALRLGGRALTYGELDRLTNQAAHTLRRLGVARGDRVGIYVQKSFASIISIFGVLKAGAVYVPLDPKAPAKRLAYITRNAGIRHLLTASAQLRSLPEFFADGTPLEHIVLIDDPTAPAVSLPSPARLTPWSEVLKAEAGPVPDLGAIETDLAYILYTSGSTGVPKGVMIAHRTIFTFIDWCRDTFRVTERDRVTSHAPLHFDLSTFDIFVPIQAGATIVLVPDGLSLFPAQLADLLQNERITITYLVPSILTMMVTYGKLDAHAFPALRALLFAGEVLPLKYLRQLVAAIPKAEYYNLYGPTETNVCTYYKVRPEDLAPENVESAVPIGQACENVEVFAVDDQGMRVLEPGVEGELWVRGSCVAQGYWGDLEKTAQAFVPNPFQPAFTEVAYRTGDIVTLASDRKNWRYVGRRDHMVKSRGYRIDLGEVESVLYRHQGIKEAVIVAVPDEMFGARLHAFVAFADGVALSAKELEQFCLGHVPKYMIPEHFEFRSVLPKTSSGKIDRQALKATLIPGFSGAAAASA